MVQRVREACSRPVCGTEGAFYGFYKSKHSLGMITQKLKHAWFLHRAA